MTHTVPFISVLAVLLASCVSTQVDGPRTSIASDEQRMEEMRRELALEEQKRQAVLAEARRLKEEAQRQKAAEEKARAEAEQRRAEEERRRLEIERQREQTRREQDRAAQKADAEREEEERRKEEAERLRAEEERRRMEEERRREERKRQREELLTRTDPDRTSFFRREMEEELSDLECGASEIRFFRNRRPLQFYTQQDDPEIDQPSSGRNLRAAVRTPGNFIVLDPEKRLVRCTAGGRKLRIVNIQSDGSGNYWVTLLDNAQTAYITLREDLEFGDEPD